MKISTVYCGQIRWPGDFWASFCALKKLELRFVSEKGIFYYHCREDRSSFTSFTAILRHKWYTYWKSAAQIGTLQRKSLQKALTFCDYVCQSSLLQKSFKVSSASFHKDKKLFVKQNHGSFFLLSNIFSRIAFEKEFLPFIRMIVLCVTDCII